MPPLTLEHRIKISRGHGGPGLVGELRRTCACDGCDRPTHGASDLCDPHLKRRRRHGESFDRGRIDRASRGRNGALAANSRNGRGGSWPEQVMAALLEFADVRFEAQVSFAHYVVDFWLPATGAVIEVDGEYWHRKREMENPGWHATRDAAIIAAGATTVIRIGDSLLTEWRKC